MSPKLLLAPLLMTLLAGCVARTAANLVTAPMRVASSGVDRLTTSQSEADEKRGREIRRREDRLRQDYNRHSAQCMRGQEQACDAARLDYAALQNLRSR